MLTKSDIEIIGNIIDDKIEPIKGEIKILKNDVDVLKKDVSILKKDMKVIKKQINGIRQDINVIISYFERDHVRLSKRVDRIENHLRLPPIQ